MKFGKHQAFFLFLLSTIMIYAEPSFSGFAGAALDVFPKEEIKPELKMRGLFAGQYSISDFLILRGTFEVNTEDIISSGLFEDTISYFSINEFCCTYQFATQDIIQQLTVFKGLHESIGSDIFLKRHLGTVNIGSPFLTPQLNFVSSGIYDYSGLGFSYVIKLAGLTGIGVYSYYDNKYDFNHINFDIRFASVWDTVILDTSFGIGMPIENEDDDGNEVFLLIRRADLHTGISLLLGNNPTTNLLLQFGLQRIQTKPIPGDTIISLEDLYAVIEPRFTTEFLKCYVTFYWLPNNVRARLQYAKKPIGCNIMLSTLPFTLLGKMSEAGINFTVGIPLEIENIMFKDIDLQIAPFISASIFSGKLESSLILKPLKILTPTEAFSLTVGYKSSL